MHNRPWSRARRTVLLGALSSLLFACSPSPAQDDATSPGHATAPAQGGSPVAVCGHTEPGPTSAPVGAVTVDPEVRSDLTAKTDDNPPGTTFWLAPGTHRLGDGEFDQVMPKDGNVYLGAPGAVLDGRGANKYAFSGQAENVSIQHLTVQGFVPPRDEGVVNHDSGDGWKIEFSTIQKNGGAGMMAGARQQVRGNCLRDNGQYGMNAYQSANGVTGLVVEGNEIVGNNTEDWESQVDGCGCTGGIKFWAVNGADIRDNWVHDNRGAGLWADTNNNDFLIEHNVIEDNDGPAIMYEISYNAIIRDNTIRRNNMVEGKGFVDRGDNFPAATIYLSEAGGEPRVKARTSKIDIYRNVLTDNWSGITLWENADRFCNSEANTSGGCTLLVADRERCSPPDIESDPLRADCRWKTQNVDIHDNRFSVDAAAMGCGSMCARMAILSNYGTFPEWSPYKADAVQDAITFDQHNTWRDNHYVGPWTFTAHDTSKTIHFGQWQSTPFQQDQNSTLERSGG
ncbi:MAG: right-handed parallel beta-helix repeat-containing protein [Actinophytocola sp.]|uniref:right-handed parallel beta-helix repeat-containing protein n=1 Tax=Actinophytocola sp. TaxID=1872138 RepID=UPI00132159BE|nr:right-handed parallel beta-helix repeat-containing protein [Actinophytocola sp.]MPZ79815.1 right-handed parallel beta-helix repeat-containing protein [Actinophytocola sp.]